MEFPFKVEARLLQIINNFEFFPCDPHQIEHRPWGWFQILDEYYSGLTHIKEKLIRVFPKGILSLQYHNYRTEYWYVKRGSGKAIIGSDEIELTVGKTLYIPNKTIHRIINNSMFDLDVLEIQLGQDGIQLSENDIVRMEDKYGRSSS